MMKDSFLDKSVVDSGRDFKGEVEDTKKLKEICKAVVEFVENADSVETLRSGLQVRLPKNHDVIIAEAFWSNVLIIFCIQALNLKFLDTLSAPKIHQLLTKWRSEVNDD
jgi:hypothetical protein